MQEMQELSHQSGLTEQRGKMPSPSQAVWVAGPAAALPGSLHRKSHVSRGGLKPRVVGRLRLGAHRVKLQLPPGIPFPELHIHVSLLCW